MGDRAVAKGKDALGGLRSGFLRGRGGPPPSLHPRPGCGLSLGAPPLPAGAGSAGVAGPCGQRELPRFPAWVPAGLRATLGWVWFWLCWDLKEVFSLLRAPVSSSVKWASTFPRSVRTETVCGVEHVPWSATRLLALQEYALSLPFLVPLASSTHFLRPLGRLGSREDL